MKPDVVGYALPAYFLEEILSIKKALDSIEYKTDFLSINLKKMPVYFDGDTDPSGYFEYMEDFHEYIFFVNEKTLQGITEGYL